MALDGPIVAAFLGVVLVGAYVQTVTGFAMGLIVMGLVTALDLLAVPLTAAVMSILAFANAVLALARKRDAVERRTIVLIVIGMIPGMIVGLSLLEYLSRSWVEGLKAILGLFITVCGASLIFRPEPRERPASQGALLGIGLSGGLCGGLFSISGAPLAFFFYCQPLSIAVIRGTLLTIFAVSSLIRTSLVAIRGEMTIDIVVYTGLGLPAVFVGTVMGRKWAPKWTDLTMRRVAFVLLLSIGVFLLAGSLKSRF